MRQATAASTWPASRRRCWRARVRRAVSWASSDRPVGVAVGAVQVDAAQTRRDARDDERSDDAAALEDVTGRCGPTGPLSRSPADGVDDRSRG